MRESEANIDQLIKLILDAKTGNAKTNPQLMPLKVNAAEYSSVSVPKNTLKSYIGTYQHRFFRQMEVYLEKGQLKMKGEILGTFNVFPQGNHKFAVEDLPELPLRFEKATAENPKGTSVTRSNERRIPIEFILYY